MNNNSEQVNDKDNENFNLHIKLGTLHEKAGEIDKSIEHFKSAYESAILLKNKRYQVDSLIRITEGHFYKGEIEISIKFAGVVEELLKELDYVEGKLDISLFLLKVYYKKNEYYKAREIGNEALKLCTDEYIVYKGRILNALAKLYFDLTSVNEHLDLLKQALECFEKGNFLSGSLGILNNIAAVYSDKLQDNEKALEYFFKLKQQSEDSNYIEFNAFAYINIGDTYFKCLKYKEAMHWSKLGLEKANEAQFEMVVFYSYVILTSINLKLNNFKDAYDYFNLATKELQAYPDQGELLPWYYKSAADLFLEFGEYDRAKHYIKQALDMLGNEESIIKWNTGIAYEFINLKVAKNKTEILDALEGITYILSKYKNSQVILDIVHEAALELIDLGECELAYKLVDKYRSIEIQNNYSLKREYIEAIGFNNEKRQLMLNTTLQLAVESKNNKVHLKICGSLGEYYFKLGNCKKTLTYYIDACTQVKKIVMSIPEEFRISFINSNNLFRYFNALIQVKQHYYKATIYDNINDEFELIRFLEELDEILI